MVNLLIKACIQITRTAPPLFANPCIDTPPGLHCSQENQTLLAGHGSFLGPFHFLLSGISRGDDPVGFFFMLAPQFCTRDLLTALREGLRIRSLLDQQAKQLPASRLLNKAAPQSKLYFCTLSQQAVSSEEAQSPANAHR